MNTGNDSDEDFMNFLSTGSGYIGLDPAFKEGLHNDLKELFDNAGGKITRSFNSTLYIAKKLD